MAIYLSDRHNIPHIIGIEVNRRILDLVSKVRNDEANRLGVSVRDYEKNRSMRLLTGIGPDLEVEPASFNKSDGSYVQNDKQPAWPKRVKVIVSNEKAGMTEYEDGNLSVLEELPKPLTYTKRLFGDGHRRGKLGEVVQLGQGRGRQRGGRPWRNQGHGGLANQDGDDDYKDEA